jgi:hypothetical protein
LRSILRNCTEVYPPVGSGNGLSEGQSNDWQPGDGSSGTGGLERELHYARERISLLESERVREREQLLEQIEDLRGRLDRAEEESGDQDRRLTALLTDQRCQKSRRRWWHRKPQGSS